MRKISVTVKPNSKKESVVHNPADDSFVVRVNAPPIEGKANERVIQLLADHLKVPRSAVTLVHGARGKKKLFQIG